MGRDRTSMGIHIFPHCADHGLFQIQGVLDCLVDLLLQMIYKIFINHTVFLHTRESSQNITGFIISHSL